MGDHTAGMTLAGGGVRGAGRATPNRHRASWSRTSLYRQGAYTVSFDLNTLPDDRAADRDRAARVDGQPVHEQLRGR